MSSVLLELLTVDVTTLADGQGTRYRAELNVKLRGLETMSPEDVKKIIDTVIADPATASAVSKTVTIYPPSRAGGMWKRPAVPASSKKRCDGLDSLTFHALHGFGISMILF